MVETERMRRSEEGEQERTESIAKASTWPDFFVERTRAVEKAPLPSIGILSAICSAVRRQSCVMQKNDGCQDGKILTDSIE